MDKKLGPYMTDERDFYATHVAQASGPCYQVAITPAHSVLGVDQVTQLAANETDLLNNTVDATFIWTSSDTSVATVDSNGYVTAHTAGSTTITAADPMTTISGVATITVPCAEECYVFSFPAGIPQGQTVTIFFYGEVITAQTPYSLTNMAAGSTFTIPISEYYPTQPDETLHALVEATGPIKYHLTIPSPFVFQLDTPGVTTLNQTDLDYTFPATGGGAFVTTYVPQPPSE